VTPAQFITDLFGDGWTEEQLPVFLEILRQTQHDALRYYVIRDAASGDLSSQSDLRKFDIEVDKARQSGLI
jgi:hypothetical protein